MYAVGRYALSTKSFGDMAELPAAGKGVLTVGCDCWRSPPSVSGARPRNRRAHSSQGSGRRRRRTMMSVIEMLRQLTHLFGKRTKPTTSLSWDALKKTLL